jgi:hypothetical protein
LFVAHTHTHTTALPAHTTPPPPETT